jgi:hypothetical protein
MGCCIHSAAIENVIDGTKKGVPKMTVICAGCGKAVDEAETSMCIHCSAEFCGNCEPNCGCQQVLNAMWDAEEATVARVAALAVN